MTAYVHATGPRSQAGLTTYGSLDIVKSQCFLHQHALNEIYKMFILPKSIYRSSSKSL